MSRYDGVAKRNRALCVDRRSALTALANTVPAQRTLLQPGPLATPLDQAELIRAAPMTTQNAIVNPTESQKMACG